jgi:predicted nuclease of predicted toxin-antitoxin system
VKFLVDAHLPRRLVHRLRQIGHDAVHTLDLPQGNRTTDAEINEIVARERRVVVTKDADFVNSFIISRRPAKLLLVSTGNITNADLEALVVAALPAIEAAFQTHAYVELSRTTLIVHT